MTATSVRRPGSHRFLAAFQAVIPLMLALSTTATLASEGMDDAFQARIANYGPAPVAAAVLVTADERLRQVGSAEAGEGQDRLFEIGSVSKLFTTLLLADLIDAGHVRADSTVSDLMPDDRALAPRVGSITLSSLATHTSGLPRLPLRGPMLTRMLTQMADPYAGSTREELFQALAGMDETDLNPLGEFEYSNLGMAVLGQLLAEAMGRSYEDLIRERLLEPLGMDDTRFTREVLDDPRLQQGHRENGRAVGNWRLDAYNPAGGLVSSLADMERFLDAVMAMENPAIRQTLTPHRFDEDGQPLGGLGWIISEWEGRQVFWHNGRTGGYSSFLAWIPEDERALILLSNASHEINAPARALLLGDTDMPSHQAGLFWPGFFALMLLVAPASVFGRRVEMRQTLAGTNAKPRGWLNGLGSIFSAAFVLGLCWLLAPWQVLPNLLFGLSLALTIAVAAACLPIMKQLPALPPHGRKRSVLSFGVDSLLLLILLVLLL